MATLLCCVGQDSSILAKDFSKYVGVSQLTNDDKLSALEEHFQQHKLYLFPTRLEYDKQHSCKHAWLDEYTWLVYSPAEDGVYCKVCALFSTHCMDNSDREIQETCCI